MKAANQAAWHKIRSELALRGADVQLIIQGYRLRVMANMPSATASAAVEATLGCQYPQYGEDGLVCKREGHVIFFDFKPKAETLEQRRLFVLAASCSSSHLCAASEALELVVGKLDVNNPEKADSRALLDEERELFAQALVLKADNLAFSAEVK